MFYELTGQMMCMEYKPMNHKGQDPWPYRTWSIAYNKLGPWTSMKGVHGPQRGTSMVRNEAGVRTAEDQAHEPRLTWFVRITTGLYSKNLINSSLHFPTDTTPQLH